MTRQPTEENQYLGEDGYYYNGVFHYLMMKAMHNALLAAVEFDLNSLNKLKDR